MKCDDLDWFIAEDCSLEEVYSRSEVDEAIEELKEELYVLRHRFKLSKIEENKAYSAYNSSQVRLKELHSEIVDLKNSHYAEMADLGMENFKLKEQLRKQKIKRAEAMAKRCFEASVRHYQSYSESFLPFLRECSEWYAKWENKWKQIADKLKENKNEVG